MTELEIFLSFKLSCNFTLSKAKAQAPFLHVLSFYTIFPVFKFYFFAKVSKSIDCRRLIFDDFIDLSCYNFSL